MPDVREALSLLETSYERDRAIGPTSSSRLDFLYSVALVLFIGASAWALLDHFLLMGQTLSFPFPLSYAEGLAIDRALQMPNLQALYTPVLTETPLRVSPQPPLHPALAALLLPLDAATDAPFAAVRALSLIAYVCAGLAAALAVYGLTRSAGGGAIAGLLLLLHPQLQNAAAMAAPDALGLALSLIGFALTTLCGPATDRRVQPVLVGAGAAFVAALAVQPFAVAPMLCSAAVWLLTHRRRTAAVALLVGVAAVAGAAVLVLQLQTNGGMLQHIFDFGVREWSRLDAMRLMLNQMLRTGLIFVPCVLFFITEPLGARHVAARAVLALLAPAFALAIVDSRFGSTWTITLPLSAATCISFGVVIAWLRPVRWLAALGIVFALLQVDTLRDWRAEEFAPQFTRKLNIARELAQLRTQLIEAGDPVLTDEHIAVLSLAGRPPTLYPLEMNALHQRGIWSIDDLVAAIERKEFSLIAWYEPIDRNDKFIMTRWPEEVRKAVYRNYYDSGYLAYTVLYRPNR